MARRFAREQKRTYEQLRLIVAHLGSGITVSAHQDGRMIDSNSIEEGPFGPDRTGGLPVRALVQALLQRQVHARASSTARSSETAGSSPIWARAT